MARTKGSILNYHSSGLGGVLKAVKHKASHADKILAKKRKEHESEKEKVYRRKMNVNLSGKNETKHKKGLEKDFSDRKEAIAKIRKGNPKNSIRKNYTITKVNKVKKIDMLAPAKPKYNRWGDRIS